MFLRLVADSFGRRPRHKLLTGAALALGMGVATAALSVALDVGDRLAKEFRSLGANLVVTPKADSLPLEIGGVDYRPVNAGAYLPEADLPKLKTIFWHNNIIAFAPMLEVSSNIALDPSEFSPPLAKEKVPLIGTWPEYDLPLRDGTTFTTGIEKTNPWFHVAGRWFREGPARLRRNFGQPDECVVGARLARQLNLHVGAPIFVNGSNTDKYSLC